MQDTAKNLAFLSRRVSALEKKVQSLEANIADNIITTERLAEVVDVVISNQKYFKEWVANHERQATFDAGESARKHSVTHYYLNKVAELLPALEQHLDNDLSIRVGREG